MSAHSHNAIHINNSTLCVQCTMTYIGI